MTTGMDVGNSDGFFGEPDLWCALDTCRFHCLAQLGAGEYRLGVGDRVELVDEGDVVGVLGALEDLSAFDHRPSVCLLEGVEVLAPGVVVRDGVADKGCGHARQM